MGSCAPGEVEEGRGGEGGEEEEEEEEGNLRRIKTLALRSPKPGECSLCGAVFSQPSTEYPALSTVTGASILYPGAGRDSAECVLGFPPSFFPKTLTVESP